MPHASLPCAQARTNSRKAYELYARTMAEVVQETSIRGILAFRDDVSPVPLDEVERFIARAVEGLDF